MRGAHPWARVGSAIVLVAAMGCAQVAEDDEATATPGDDGTAAIAAALTFHASFDAGPDADYALGDATLYAAPSYQAQEEALPGIGSPDIEIVEGAGRFGDGLEFRTKNEGALFYRAPDNVAFAQSGWSGTVSLWLSVDPAEDLAPGFTDPIQITDVAYNDAAIWVDFTGVNPRQFRLGVFGDLEVWNPENLFCERVPLLSRATDRGRRTSLRRGGMDTRGHHVLAAGERRRRDSEPLLERGAAAQDRGGDRRAVHLGHGASRDPPRGELHRFVRRARALQPAAHTAGGEYALRLADRRRLASQRRMSACRLPRQSSAGEVHFTAKRAS